MAFNLCGLAIASLQVCCCMPSCWWLQLARNTLHLHMKMTTDATSESRPLLPSFAMHGNPFCSCCACSIRRFAYDNFPFLYIIFIYNI